MPGPAVVTAVLFGMVLGISLERAAIFPGPEYAHTHTHTGAPAHLPSLPRPASDTSEGLVRRLAQSPEPDKSGSLPLNDVHTVRNALSGAEAWFEFLDRFSLPNFEKDRQESLDQGWRDALAKLSANSPRQLRRFMDFTALQSSRSITGYTSRWHRAMMKAAKGAPMTIVVFGGSVTSGHQCRGGRGPKYNVPLSDCAWPARFQQWLREFYSNDKINVRNYAAPATGLAYAALILTYHADFMEHGVDIFMMDYSINDIRHVQHDEWGYGKPMNLTYEPRKIGFFSTEAASSIAHTHLLVTRILGLPSSPALVWLFNFDPIVGVSAVQELHSVVLQYYGVPSLSYRDAVFQEWRAGKFVSECVGARTCRAALWQDIGNAHGEWFVHEMYAMMMEYNWVLEASRLPSTTPSMKSDRAELNKMLNVRGHSAFHLATVHPELDDGCDRYITFHSSIVLDTWARGDANGALLRKGLNESSFPALAKDSGWAFKEDVPYKPGWVIDTPELGEKSITFAFTSVSGNVKVGYLQSYAQEMGKFRIEILSKAGVVQWRAGALVETRTHSHYSIVQQRVYKGVVGPGEWLIKITRVEGQKCKIVLLSTC